MRKAALLPRPTGASRPLPGSGSTASSGTATDGPDGLPTAGVTRLSIQPLPCGEAISAGSPTAHHTRRPNTSSKPPTTGFHAADGAAGAATLSHPFNGKSLSLTVRGQIADSNPSSASSP